MLFLVDPVSLQPGFSDGQQVAFGWPAESHQPVPSMAFHFENDGKQAEDVSPKAFPPAWCADTSGRSSMCHKAHSGAMGIRDWLDLCSSLHLWQHDCCQEQRWTTWILAGDNPKSWAGDLGRVSCFQKCLNNFLLLAAAVFLATGFLVFKKINNFCPIQPVVTQGLCRRSARVAHHERPKFQTFWFEHVEGQCPYASGRRSCWQSSFGRSWQQARRLEQGR